jgi:hypothetical protein
MFGSLVLEGKEGEDTFFISKLKKLQNVSKMIIRVLKYYMIIYHVIPIFFKSQIHIKNIDFAPPKPNSQTYPTEGGEKLP